MSNDNIKELTDLVRESNVNPIKQPIEKLVSEKELSQYESQDILSAAYELNCLVTKCMYHDVYRANGIWLTPSEELLNKFNDYQYISHGCCDPCKEEFKQQIKARYAKKE